jgi:hypothetical protein
MYIIGLKIQGWIFNTSLKYIFKQILTDLLFLDYVSWGLAMRTIEVSFYLSLWPAFLVPFLFWEWETKALQRNFIFLNIPCLCSVGKKERKGLAWFTTGMKSWELTSFSDYVAKKRPGIGKISPKS